MLRFLTSGESHGKCLIGVLDGMPAGLCVKEDCVNRELARRQAGYGRGGRMKIEADRVELVAGLRKGITTGAPLGILVENRDCTIDKLPAITCPRPGHADLAGAIKYGLVDMRDVLERASARETAARVAIGAICKIFLDEFEVQVLSHVVAIGDVKARTAALSFDEIAKRQTQSPVRCADCDASVKMIQRIDEAKTAGDSLGGVYEVRVRNLPVGLGSYTQYDRKLSGRLAQAILSIQGHKAVEIGDGIEGACSKGSAFHDEIFYSKGKAPKDSGSHFFRKTNRAGGMEGGMTNGEELVVRAFMKPIATLAKPLASVNVKTKKQVAAAVERADVCAVPAAGVVGEAAVAFVLADAFLEKFGSDSMTEIKRNHRAYLEQVSKF